MRIAMGVLSIALLTGGARGQDLWKQFSGAGGDPCEDAGPDLSNLESRLFQGANQLVVMALNRASTAAPRERAIAALKNLERQSAAANSSWDEDKRFHFEVLDLPPGLLVEMTFRNRATFTFFAARAGLWQQIDAVDDGQQVSSGYESLDLYPLARGTAKRARFLARLGWASCGSGQSVSYYAYEWDPGSAMLNEIIKLEGSVSQNEASDTPRDRNSFPPIGKLETEGSKISLPYCWFSAIDSWDNPSMCAVQSFDLSGDRVKFAGIQYNRPDLLPVAKAIEYSEARDYGAVLGYSASEEIAQNMVANMPPHVAAAGGDFEVNQISASRETVDFNNVDDSDPSLHFEVEQRGSRWVVVAFDIN